MTVLEQKSKKSKLVTRNSKVYLLKAKFLNHNWICTLGARNQSGSHGWLISWGS